MYWRRFKLDWRYAIGEILIVIVGVLIALIIDQWNDERLERIEEVEVLSRLISDLSADLEGFTGWLDLIDTKEESLVRVRTTLVGGETTDSRQFLYDMVLGAHLGWNQAAAVRATYDDLLGSGRLHVISDPGIRAQISGYYRNYDTAATRIDERETGYPAISYRLVPRGTTRIPEGGSTPGEGELDGNLSDEYAEELVRAVRESSIEEEVLAEINLARFMRGVALDLQLQAISVREVLREYQSGID